MLLDIHLAFQEKVLFHCFHSVYFLVLFSKEFSVVIFLDAGNGSDFLRSDFLSPHSILLLAYVSRGLRGHQLIDLGSLLIEHVWYSFDISSVVVSRVDYLFVYCFESLAYLRFSLFQWFCHEAGVHLGNELLRSGLILMFELAHASFEG